MNPKEPQGTLIEDIQLAGCCASLVLTYSCYVVLGFDRHCKVGDGHGWYKPITPRPGR